MTYDARALRMRNAKLEGDIRVMQEIIRRLSGTLSVEGIAPDLPEGLKPYFKRAVSGDARA